MTNDPIRSPSRTRYGAAASPRPASAPRRSRLWSRAAAVVALAVRCAVAAVLAWVVVTPLGGAADDFHYYAPFGAVVAVSTTVMGSVRASVQVLGAFVLGVPLALALQAWSPPTLVAKRASRGLLDLRVHDFLPDDDLWAYLASLDVSVLPYRFGTHSGWLEACRDLGTTVVAPTCGFYAEQGPVLSYGHDEEHFDAESLRAALHRAYEERPDFTASVAERVLQRAEVAAAHDEVYEASRG